MKPNKLFQAVLLFAVFTACASLTFTFSGCKTDDTTRPLPVIPKTAPVVQGQQDKDDTVTAKVAAIVSANNVIAAQASTPAVRQATAQVTQAVADIKAAIAEHPAIQVKQLVDELLTALNARDEAVAAQQKKIAAQQAAITAMQEDHALLVWLYVGFVVFALAAVACGFFASYIESIPVVGPFFAKIIGPVFAGVLGALSVTCYVLARFIIWTHEHPWIFGTLFVLGGLAGGIALVNKYDHALFAKLEADATAAINALKAELGISSPAPAPASAAPVAVAPVATATTAAVPAPVSTP